MKSRSSNLDADQWEGGRVQFWELRFRSDHLPVILCRLLNLPVSFLESKASNSCLCHMQWSPCKCQGIFLIARVQHKNEKYICESILLCDGRTAQCVGWETDAQLLKFGGGLKKLIENCFKNSSLFLSNCFPGLTICGKCFSSVPLWNSQSNGLVTPLFIFLIMIFSYRFNCWPTYSFWFEGDKTCFLLYWINIYYIYSQVWASGFISKQKRTLFFFFFFFPIGAESAFSHQTPGSLCFWKKALTVAEQCWAVAKESFREAPGSSQPGWKCYFSMLGLLCFSS